ncbi:MAG: biotin synthase [Hydrogenophaga sp.]|uniref:biotin synthase n=1 Tax=Hydrogenophaga sp. TaxID=1904254 RepID=UPI0025C25AA0|nr:biotin synthase [Hydrogenophaga sp.]MBT9550960.1 biotin synthase [Hydrogenophaga sp.]
MNHAPEDIPVPGLDPVAAERWLARIRDQSPWLHEEVARRMIDRLQWFRDPPASWLHWEPVLGGLQAHRTLAERLPAARCQVAAHDTPRALEATREPARRSWNPLQWKRGHVAAGVDTPVAMLWANMALHQVARPQPLLRQWHGQIQTDGFLMFSCLGPDSLRELRAVYARAGWPDPAHAFTDMHDWGDMLVHNGFAEPVMDMERISLSYSGAGPLLDELRSLGRNLNTARFGALRGRAWRQELEQAIDQGLPRSEDGRLLLTFEVIYGHAFKAAPRPPRGDSQSVSMDEMRAMLRDRRS